MSPQSVLLELKSRYCLNVGRNAFEEPMQCLVVNAVNHVRQNAENYAIEQCAFPRLKHVQRGGEVVAVFPAHCRD